MRCRLFTIPSAILLMICVCGCSARRTWHGDAIWEKPPLIYWGGVVPDHLLLPEFSLSQPALFRFHVRDLPQPIFPHDLRRQTHERYIIRDGERRLPEFTLRVSIQQLDGKEIFSHKIGPGDRGFVQFSIVAKDGMTHSYFELPVPHGLPELRSYDVVVEVLTPSPAPDDFAHLQTDYLH